jgi:hypothetical protein
MKQTMYEKICSFHLGHEEAANAPLLYINPFAEKQKQQLSWLWKMTQL